MSQPCPPSVSYTHLDVYKRQGHILSPEEYPVLRSFKGHTLITTDGTTLLGSDDKAGIAEILEAAEILLQGGIPHGKVCLGFTPDEEIGRGPLKFDVAGFGAKLAYTLDGGAAGSICLLYTSQDPAGFSDCEIGAAGYCGHSTLLRLLLHSHRIRILTPAC